MKKIVLLALSFSLCLCAGQTFSRELDLLHYCTKIYPRKNVEISLYTPTMFRFRNSKLPGNKFPFQYEIPFVIGKLENWQPVDYEQWAQGKFEYIRTSGIVIEVDTVTLAWKVFSAEGNKSIYPSAGPVHGMFRDGYTVFDNASALDEFNNNSRFSHWFYHPKTGRYTDTYLEDDLISDAYFIYGPEYENLFLQFNELVGPEPLLPKKAYGYFQTQHLACDGNQEQLLEVAQLFRLKDIPCDNLIIDFEWGDGCDGHKEVKWGSRLDWSPNYTSPNSPQEMSDILHGLHFNLMLIHHSAPDFINRKHQGWTESLYDERIWWKKFKEKLDIGIDGTWQDTRRNDITDGVIWSGIQEYFGSLDRVLFMGCRKMQALNPWDSYFTALPMNQLMGSRRYPFDWTGDCSYSWNELAWQIKAITNTHGAMKGVSYITSDAVGANWQIQARWNQFACFSPIVRSHNPKPWSGDVPIDDFVKKIRITGRDTLQVHTKDVPSSDAREKTAERSIRKYLKMRYRLLPYLYSYAHLLYQTGLPICRPMLLAFPHDHRCSGDQWPFQYMFGEWILVAPVYGDFTTMEIYLPEDHLWIDYWTQDIYQGGAILRYKTEDVETLPLFIKAGAILPMRQEQNWIDPSQSDDPLILDIYPSGQTSLSLFEDDGVSTHYQTGEYNQTTITCRLDSLGTYSFRIGSAKGIYDHMPLERTYLLHIHFVSTVPEGMTLNGSPVLDGNSRVKHPPDVNQWSYDVRKKIVTIGIRVPTNIDTDVQFTTRHF